ncbi:UNVERIFIED_CONTAM: hypothetical protein RF648_20720, partial [Kocuria sp. CPCC 205274]
IFAVSCTALCFTLFLFIWLLCTENMFFILVFAGINLALFAVAFFSMKAALKIDDKIEQSLQKKVF